MVQLWFELTFVALFVIMIFVGSISVPVYVLTARGRWGWAIVYMAITVGWTWALHHINGAAAASTPIVLTAAQIWWNQYLWVVLLIFYMAMGVTLGVIVRRQWAISLTFLLPVSVGCVLILASLAVLMGVGPAHLGQTVNSFVVSEMNQMVQQTIDTAKDVPAEQLALLKDVGARIIQWSIRLIPSTIWLMGLMVTALTLLLGKWLIPRPLWMKYQGGLTRWKAPGICVWLVIILGGLFFANVYGLQAEPLLPVVYNGLLAVAGLFLLQGAMIATYYIRRQREGIFRWMWYGLMVLFIQTAVIVMILLGLFDYWVDFRKVDHKIAV